MRLRRECIPPCRLTWRARRMDGTMPTRPWLIYHGPDMVTGLSRYLLPSGRRHGWVMRLASGTSTHATIGDAQQRLIRMVHEASEVTKGDTQRGGAR